MVGHSPHAATALTDGQLADLRDAARTGAGPFVDPRVLHRVSGATFPRQWAAAILGHPYPRAPVRPVARRLPPRPSARRRAEPGLAAQPARLEGGADDRVVLALRVELEVPRAGVVVDDLDVTRDPRGPLVPSGKAAAELLDGSGCLARELGAVREDRRGHGRGQTLCWTPSRATGLSHFSDHYDARIPDCTTCLRTAHRLDPGASDE